MRVIKDLSIEIPGTNTHYFKLDELSKDDGENVLLYGYVNLENDNNFNIVRDHKRKTYLNVTMPTEFCSSQPTNSDDKFDEIYGICPYTTKWLNEIKGVDKYRTTFYPFNELDIPKNTDKKYDVIYHGGIHGEKYTKMLDVMRKFNYRFASQTHGINGLTSQNLKYATNTNLTNQEKLNLISECKISICFNTFDIRNQSDIDNIKNRTDWNKNEAFKHIDDLMMAPQFKSRCNEAAFSKTLNLVKRDPWNLIEHYYETDEFIYFDSFEDLEEKIREITNNWDKYSLIVEKAYIKSLNYTTEKMYNMIKNKEKKYEM
jgi:hypothetical protein